MSFGALGDVKALRVVLAVWQVRLVTSLCGLGPPPPTR
ncbi:hypothetical protein RHOER0001_4774 [Rhodococcus erythropolis SK121]|nr:hypothetical protein RHOER0001_4774 [Rhodococcus erythropolis SK121]